MKSTLLWILLGSLLGLAVTGCHRKAPATSPDLGPAADSNTAPSVTSPGAPATSGDAVETDPWAGDIGALNRWAYEQGLLGDVYFDFDQAELRDDARDRLQKNYRFIRERPDLVFLIEGHCDERGTNEYNLVLGESRATSTRRYLQTMGIPQERLESLSFGKERPVCSRSDEECWQQNRRAHFVIVRRVG